MVTTLQQLIDQFNGRIQRSNIDVNDYHFGTPLGGWCIRLTNKSGVQILKGTVVIASSGNDNCFTIAALDSIYPLGVAAENIEINASGWIVVSGIAEVLIVDGATASAANWAGTSGTTAGRIDTTSEPPAASKHDQEIGHCITGSTAGTNKLVKVVLHFR